MANNVTLLDKSGNELNPRTTSAQVADLTSTLNALFVQNLGDETYKAVSQSALKTILTGYVLAVSGKGLSKNDLTDALLDKLNGLSNYDDTAVKASVASLNSTLNTLVSGNATTAIESFNEVIAFLANVNDTESLSSIIAGINTTVSKKISSGGLKTINGKSIEGSGDITISQGGTITVDSALSDTSENPVQNKVVKVAMDKKITSGGLKTVNGNSLEGSGDITIEAGTDISVDSALSDSSENPVQNKVVNAAIASLNSTLNSLVSGNASTAIDSFNEIVAFLASVTDSETLAGIIAGINTAIAAKITSGGLKTVNGNSLEGSGDITIKTGTDVTVDNALSDTSENPVQNKVVKVAMDKKITSGGLKTVNGNSLEGSGDITIEAGTDVTVDSALSDSSENPVQNKVVNAAIASLNSTLNTLVSGNASTAIDSFNEIVAFLASVTDSDTLAGIIAGINTAIATKITSGGLKTINGESIEGAGDISILGIGNTLNMLALAPLDDGFYTLATAIAAVPDKYRALLRCISYKSDASTVETKQFVGTQLSSWESESAWTDFNSKIKAVSVNGTVQTVDGNGLVNITVQTINVDETIDANSTNPVMGKAVAAEFNNLACKYGVSLLLNESGSGDSKVYSISLIDEKGNVLSTTDQFSAGGSGSTAATKISLTRVGVASQTVKEGSNVKLSYKYDHLDTASGETTGNSATALVTIIHGSNTSSYTVTIAAGGTYGIDVSSYIGVGSNTVRVKVSVGEGSELQVQTMTWTVNVVKLSLTSTFSIASVINKGDTVSVPFVLSGSGTKTLKCYVDGVYTDSRSITSSSSPGTFSIDTASMAHGSHTVQMVAELELSDSSVLKSNSIFFAFAVRVSGNTSPIVAARFDFSDGTLVIDNSLPYISISQYENYTLQYAVYDPTRTPAEVSVYDADNVLSNTSIAFSATSLTVRALTYGTRTCKIVCGVTTFKYSLYVTQSELNLTEAADGLQLKLTSSGHSNNDTDKETWKDTDHAITASLSGVKFGGDGWLDGVLKLRDGGVLTVPYKPLATPVADITNAMAFFIRFKVSDVVDESAELVKCMDSAGTGFVITPYSVKFVTRGGSSVAMMLADETVYEIGFVSYPAATADSSDDETKNNSMVVLYINGVASNSVQRGTSDSVYQADPMNVNIGADGATIDVYTIRAYSTYLSGSQALDLNIIDQDSSEQLIEMYNKNNITDGNGNITPDKTSGLPCLIITGVADNGMAQLLNAAVQNQKKPKYNTTSILYVDPSDTTRNWFLSGGCISLQGTSSLAYPIKNYRLYSYDKTKVAGSLYLGCDAQGVGGSLQDVAAWSLHKANDAGKLPALVKCLCPKADYAESSSSHNTGMARFSNDILVAAGELTPAQDNVDSDYAYDVRTTVDGLPILMFYRATVDDDPVFLGKYNLNNDKSTEVVFGFVNIPGYNKTCVNYGDFTEVVVANGTDLVAYSASYDHTSIDTSKHLVFTEADGANKRVEYYNGSAWILADNEVNPVECWEFLNNDYDMGKFLNDDFDAMVTDEDGNSTPAWMNVFEARYPDDDDNNAEYEAGTKKPYYLKRLVSWILSCKDNTDKFKSEVGNYFAPDFLCDYYMLTEIFGCVDQRVKNMMFGFWKETVSGKVLCYPIFYDCDTILGVRNDGRLKYSYDIDENSVDAELTSAAGSTKYAYAGHDSVLWSLLRVGMADELSAAYKRLRTAMGGTNDMMFKYFDTQQTDMFPERIYNVDAMNKYIVPKTIGVDVVADGVTTTTKYSYLECMQGNRKAHRHWWLTNRMKLLDARYSSGQFTSIDIAWKGASAAGAVVAAVPSRDYYFEIRREGTTMAHNKVTKDTAWSYTYDSEANVGTIFHLFGADFMKELDLSLWGGFVDLTFSKAMPKLEKLVLGADGKTYTLSEFEAADKFPMLKSLVMRNYTAVTSINLAGSTRLQSLDFTGCTALTAVSIEEGVPLKSLLLPENYTTLVLRSLSVLTRDDITLANAANIQTLWVENCALIDGYSFFKELYAMTGTKLSHVRLAGLSLKGNGSDLVKYMNAGIGGLDMSGNLVTRCKLLGSYQLTSYLDENVYSSLCDYFDELNISQPQFTMIEFDDSVSDDANVSNLDNKSGYKYGTDYVCNGHISKILGGRFRCLGKQAVNGTMSIYPLHNENSNYYADDDNVGNCTPAALDSTEGDVFMYEPHYWFKGVNDILNNKHYSCYSSNADKPDCPDAAAISLEDITNAGNYRAGYKIMTGKDTLANSYTSDSSYAACVVGVSGYKRVRFPSVPGSSLMGASFIDSEGNVISSVIVQTLTLRFEPGMYVVADVPSNAVSLAFTILKTAEFDFVLLSNSDNIEDMEPGWVEHPACLTAVFGSTIVGSKLRSCITGGTTSGSISWTDFNYYSSSRKLQQIDYSMHRDIANLFFAKYGRRDSQSQCGYGYNSYSRITGGTAVIGMQDTVNPELKTSSAWYLKNGSYVQIDNINCLGYEDIYGNKWDGMDNVSLPNNTTGDLYKWLITEPDGSTRKVKGSSYNGLWITGMVHQKYMDVIPAGTYTGSNSTFYCDYFQVLGSASRVVYRGSYYSNSYGGVSFTNAYSDASYSFTYVGSRLAFRGVIVRAESVTAFKALSEIA